MAGLYIHVPLCGAQRCIYCDFYSTRFRGHTAALTQAYVQELKDRLREADAPWADTEWRTLYIGGGTPTQLPGADVRQLLADIGRILPGTHLEEVTLEANPEDVTPHYLSTLLRTRRGTDSAPWRVNRVSLGVQSLDDAMLAFLGRRHDSARALQAVSLLRQHDIHNISIDLIYGLPGQTLEAWSDTLSRAIDLGVPHLSAYALTLEPGTRLAALVESRQVRLPDEEEVLRMADLLRQRLADADLKQYEISNFARPGFESRHNSAYWTGAPYLGLGPAAHSYDGAARRTWNAPDLAAYLRGQCPRHAETLTPTDRYNERIMLGLRTRSGVDLDALRHDFPTLVPEADIAALVAQGVLRIAPADSAATTSRLTLTPQGLPLADHIIRTLFAL